MNEKIDLSTIKKENTTTAAAAAITAITANPTATIISSEKKEKSLFSPASKDPETARVAVVPAAPTITTTTPIATVESRDTISEVIKEVLTKALSSDPYEDVFLSVIKSRENVVTATTTTRPFIEQSDGLEILSSSMSSPILSENPSLVQSSSSSIANNIPYQHQRHPDPPNPCRSSKTIATANFIRPQFLTQNDIKPNNGNNNPSSTDLIIKSPGIIAQSFPKSDFYSTNCQIQQKPNLSNDSLLLHHHQHQQHHNQQQHHPQQPQQQQQSISETVSKPAKRRSAAPPKSTNKKQKLSESLFHDKLNIPMQRYQQIMVKQLGTPNFRKLVHEPRIKNNLTVLAPLGCKQRLAQCSDVHQLQDNCVKYKRVPFTMPQINPIHLRRTTDNSDNNGFILQNINASIPEGVLLSTHDSDDIDCLIAPSPSNNELDYLSVFNCDPISSPSVSLSAGPNLEMLHPPNRTQSPQLSVFHCPNKDYLKFDQSDHHNHQNSNHNASQQQQPSPSPLPSRKTATDCCQGLLRATGISRVQISHKYSTAPPPPIDQSPIDDNALIDSETGEVVSKPTSNGNNGGDRAISGTGRNQQPREKLLMTFTINPPDDVEKTVRNITDVLGIDYSSVEFKETTRGGEIAIDKDSIVSDAIPREICERYNTSVVVNSDGGVSDKLLLPPLYSEKVYKSTALLQRAAMRCVHCDKPLPGKCRDSVAFCDEHCQQEFGGTMTMTTIGGAGEDSKLGVGELRDQRIFIGDDNRCDASVIVQGSISKSKQISKRLGAIINDKLLKKKAAAAITAAASAVTVTVPPFGGCPTKVAVVHKGSKYRAFRHAEPRQQQPINTNNNNNPSVISDSEFHSLSRQSRTVLRLAAVPPVSDDSRLCALCQRPADQQEHGPGRLLCLDGDRWLHVNCALWCNNVFEMQCGALNNVAESVAASLRVACTSCGLAGAGIACYYPRCSGTFHVPCALDSGCRFFADRAMYCPLHSARTELGPHLVSLAVDRRVYIARDELAQVARTVNGEDSCCLRVGSLVVTAIGQLLPHQIMSGRFHNLNHVYPCGFRSRRIHWSSRVLNARSMYHCEIVSTIGSAGGDELEQPLFRVTATDVDWADECHVGASCAEAWQKLLRRIATLRSANGVVKFFPEHIKAEDLFGLTEPHVLRAIESLPGLETLSDYAFKFGKMQLIVEMPLPVNATGSVRTEPFVKLYRHMHKPTIHHQSPTFQRQTVAITTTILSSTTTPSISTTTRSSDNNNGGNGSSSSSLALLLQQQHSNSVTNSNQNCKINLSNKWQQYRKLRTETKLNVVLKRSKIQGFGLCAARDIEKGTMIIEYVGELIRNEVANRREQLYESRKQGIYMFRLDPATVIDATRAGDLARYINHCCEPNCVTELLEFEKESHIVIISNRKIDKSEELTYDYKFDLDDGKDDKIPCMCGARNCRRWMN